MSAVTTRAALLETYARTDVTFVRGAGAWLEDADGARYLEEVKGGAFWVYGAAGEAGAQSMWETDLTSGVAIVLGAEGKGLRPLVRRMCDALVSIPLSGEVESLNVSVAAAVLLYEARRQRS